MAKIIFESLVENGKLRLLNNALKSGLKKDDILLAVDDKDSNKFTLFMLHRYLKKPGQVLKLKISRQGKILQLQLKLEAY